MIVGITGGSGCGKTTLLEVLKSKGALVLDCDAIYHDLLRTDACMLQTISLRFPEAVENGQLDCKKLGNIVFADKKALQDLKGTEDDSTTDFQNIAAANIIGADSENAAPTIRLVNSFLEYAVNQNCSDIHLEPRESAMFVRMRIDGVLRQVSREELDDEDFKNRIIAALKGESDV